MRSVHTSADRQTYTEVGEEGIEEGEREPTLCVRRCCELRFDNFRSRVGLARFELEVMCRRSVGERLLDIEVSASCEGRLKSAMEDMTRTSWREWRRSWFGKVVAAWTRNVISDRILFTSCRF